MRKTYTNLVALIVALSVLLTACAGATPTPATTPTPMIKEVIKEVPAAPKPQSLTIYSGRSETLVDPIIQQFGQATGIEVAVKYAKTAQLAATLQEEGEKSPADIFFAQDPGGLGAVEDMLVRLPDGMLDQVSGWAHSPDGRWVGISGRARVVVYNTERLTESDLPDSIFAFTDPQWKGRIGWPPTNASFQTMVTAMRVIWGEDKTRQWLLGIQANDPKIYPKNTPTVAAAGAGEIDVGFVNHYYLYRFLQEHGESFAARNYHLPSGGPGALVMVAGAGILSTSGSKEAAQRFLKFMLSPVAQQYFTGQTFEYPLVEGVKTNRLLTPLNEITRPQIDLGGLKDIRSTQALFRETGILP
ncbi:MAG: iron ABC transporter substrate-binding protein [Dehalococcoidia bacterium]|nr:iron ABC transporter substrate-binding protein [Dehalococcoidia bacterium]